MERSVATRTSLQCARPGWRPKVRPLSQLIPDIVQSIRAAAAQGIVRTPADYTPNVQVQRQIRMVLAQGNET